MKALLILVALAAGCGMQVDQGKVVEPPEHAEAAVQALTAFYGMDRAPTVIWYGKGLDCVDHVNRPWCGDGGICWESDNRAGCTEGETEDRVSLVSTMSGTVPLHETPLAHEIAHQYLGPDHTDAFYDKVDEATGMLALLGM